jgi:2Fe-2S ferredoxin
MMPSVTYVEADGTRHEVEVPIGDNVMRGAVNNGIEGIVGECGGGLACATCHCYVDDAWADRVGGPSSEDERDMLESAAAEVRPTSRLSCQIAIETELDGLVVLLPERQY